MTLSSIIYYNLCETRRQLKSAYKRGSNLHRHHIVPIHNGGNDVEENCTYLNIREHKIAHYLLWRIYGMVNDLRAFHMLGGILSDKMRKIVGDWCFENKIGMFAKKHQKHRKQWAQKGIQKQIKNKIGIFDPTKTSYHASIGGKASVKTNKVFQYWFSREGKIKRASMGAKSHTGKRAMYKPGDETFIRVSLVDIDKHLSIGYLLGSPLKANKGKHMVSKRKKKVSDGVIIYDSLHAAANALNMTPSGILYRIRSSRFPWKYVCDI